MEAFLLAASPRMEGNSAFAAHLFAEAAREEVTFLHKKNVSPCIACDYCVKHPGICSIQDDAPALLRTMRTVPLSVIFSPIYMYHVPAQLKALLDRGQMWYHAPEISSISAVPQSVPSSHATTPRLGLVLHGGRPRGEKLFEGALRSMRIFGQATGLTLLKPLCLYGLDEKDALSRNQGAQEQIRAYALGLLKQTEGA